MNSLTLLRISTLTFTIALLFSHFSYVQVLAKHEEDLKEKYEEEKKVDQLNVKRSDFPSDFIFGVATAAPQIEGAASQDGKGKSIWDEFIQTSQEKIKDGSNISIAIDSYNRYLCDVKALKEIGVDYYRFSIPWARILPNGSISGGVNRKAIDHYNKLIDELLKIGVKPSVTLLHFDSPQAIQEKYGGFLSKAIINDFKDYSKICFEEFGDRVKQWTTINEPLIVAQMGFDLGVAAPGRCSAPFIAGKCPAGDSSTEPYIVAHNALLAHAAAVKLYKDNYQKKQGGEIGLSVVGKHFEPYSNSPEDQAAAQRLFDFELGWFMEPLVFGDYPRSMRELVKERLPRFSNEERFLVKGSFDFIGVNYYTSRYAKNAIPPQPKRYSTDSLATQEVERDGVLIGPKAEGSGFLYVYPEGLHKFLLFMNTKYQRPKIYIMENGITEANNKSIAVSQALKDPHRITNTLRHLYMINVAIKSGVNVKGYFIWTLFDDFEWGEGYIPRFGLYYVDYQDNLKRIPKSSAKWLPAFLSGNNNWTIF